MNFTLPEIFEKMKNVDEITLLEILDITSEEIVDKFQDKIEERYDEFNQEFEEDEE